MGPDRDMEEIGVENEKDKNFLLSFVSLLSSKLPYIFQVHNRKDIMCTW